MPLTASGLCCVVTLLSAPLILNYLVGPCLVCHQSYTPHLIHTQTPLNNGDYIDNLRCSCVQKSPQKFDFNDFLSWCFESGIFVCLHWRGLQCECAIVVRCCSGAICDDTSPPFIVRCMAGVGVRTSCNTASIHSQLPEVTRTYHSPSPGAGAGVRSPAAG